MKNMIVSLLALGLILTLGMAGAQQFYPFPYTGYYNVPYYGNSGYGSYGYIPGTIYYTTYSSYYGYTGMSSYNSHSGYYYYYPNSGMLSYGYSGSNPWL